MRIACVQNGDFTSALRNFRAGGRETYNGQFYTVGAYRNFTAGQPNLVISLDASPHEQTFDACTATAVARPRMPIPLPRRVLLHWQARRIIRRLEEFATTHLLIRCVDVVGCELLAWSISRGIPAAAIVAGRFNPRQAVCRRFCKLAAAPNVAFAANHNRVATQSLLDCGLPAGKALAWDLPPAVEPRQYPSKRRQPGQPISLLFAGSMLRAKGVMDLVGAVERCQRQGLPVDLTLCGDGRMLDRIRAHWGIAAGWLKAPGRLEQGEVLRRMIACDLVAVASHADYAEGLPFVIEEALAVRTPLILSDHPVFVKYFQDGQAVRFFPQTDRHALARVIRQIADDPAQYARLSEQTQAAWESIQCPLKFHELLGRLSDEWAPRPARSEPVALAV